jgi:mannosyltransferase OCH1-like enzyme
MYMHHFGGLYADLDLVPLHPLPKHIPLLNHPMPTPSPLPIIYLGHMGDDSYEHSIPNAFMLSLTPAHPFWLRPLEYVKTRTLEGVNTGPEGLTGPVALRACVKEWEREREVREGNGEFGEVRVLPNERVRAHVPCRKRLL